jgi:putative transposase
MPYWRLFYHLVWATKGRAPLLTPEIEGTAHDLLRRKALALEGRVFAIGGVEDHVHMIVAIPPKIAVARFVGQVKASAATQLNRLTQREGTPLWQEEYGAFSFDGKRLPNYIAYVEQQREHHAANRLIPVLERATDQQLGVPIVREVPASYRVTRDDWWQELLELDVGDTLDKA